MPFTHNPGQPALAVSQHACHPGVSGHSVTDTTVPCGAHQCQGCPRHCTCIAALGPPQTDLVGTNSSSLQKRKLRPRKVSYLRKAAQLGRGDPFRDRSALPAMQGVRHCRQTALPHWPLVLSAICSFLSLSREADEAHISSPTWLFMGPETRLDTGKAANIC